MNLFFSEIGILCGFETQIQLEKTSRKINGINLSFHIHLDRNNTRSLRWYFDISVFYR